MRYLKLQNELDVIYCYKIADSFYLSDTVIKGLEHLLQPQCLFQERDIVANELDRVDSKIERTYKSTLHNKLTPIGNNNYQLRVLTESGNYQIQNQNNLYQIEDATIVANIEYIDITLLMGPVFILQLAKNKTFCLHASSFIIDDTCFILMADSGTGKSTIAKYIQDSQIGSRIADDIIPVNIVKDEINVLPNFPQLKLKRDDQYIGSNICQKTVLLFTQISKSETCVNSLKHFAAIKKLIKHSVATKLFADIELKNHLAFCHNLSRIAQSYQLNYQHSQKGLEQLQEILSEMA